MGKINISTAALKAYANEQRAMSNECYSKQSQFHTQKQLTLLAGREIATSLRASQGRAGMKQDGLRSSDKPAAAGKLRTSFGICD